MDAERIADLAQQQTERLRLLEQRSIATATHPLASALTDAQAAAVTRWVHEATGAQIPTRLAEFIDWVRDLINRAFNSKGGQAKAAAERAAFTAASLAAHQTGQLAAAMTGQHVPPIAPDAGPEAQAAADRIPVAVQEEHGQAIALLTAAGLAATGLAGLNSAFKRARRAVGRIAQGVAVAVGAAASHAVTLITRTLGPGVRLLWVTERGACAACRAYAGRHIRPGGQFPGGLSLDPRRTVFASPVSGPPRHPHCRCTLIPWSPAWPVSGLPLPAVLRRRARADWRPA
ncbi:hypothetical protein ACIQPQ_31205 [Streptomyces sp. NPDC091281]|uniref:hypothetical protein n=1 Tax=Streptomyces sp. NPDC091281 TaxID=3365985 RepID=UPI0037FEEE53